MKNNNKNNKNYNNITLRVFIITIFTWLLVGILVSIQYIFFIPFIALWTILFDRERKKVMFFFTKFFIRLFFLLYITSNFTINLGGLKKPKTPRIYMLNHASQFDTFLMYLLPGRLKVFVKEVYLKLPFIGWTIWLSGNIYVKKAKNEFDDQNELITEGERQLLDGSSLVIFPEGTKSKDGNIGRFKSGGFKIAYDTKADIVPVVLDTWNSIRPGGGGWIRDDKIWLKVLKTIPFDKYKDLDMFDFTKMLRMIMSEELINIRNQRRKMDKKYYRNAEKYKLLDEDALNKIIDYKKKHRFII